MSYIPPIPCIKDKCLMVPVCRNRIEIYCDILMGYLNKLNMKSNLYPEGSIWFKMRKTLPKLEVIAFTGQVFNPRTQEYEERIERAYIEEAKRTEWIY